MTVFLVKIIKDSHPKRNHLFLAVIDKYPAVRVIGAGEKLDLEDGDFRVVDQVKLHDN